MTNQTTTAQAADGGQTHPTRARAKVWLGETLVAETSAAVTTGLPEYNARLLVPASDVRGEAVGPGETRDGQAYVVFDPALARIELTDERPGNGDAGGTTNKFPRWGDVSDLIAHSDLKDLGEGVFEAAAYGDLQRDVIEGTELLGKAIVAASRFNPEQRVVSVHGVFGRAASYSAPLRFDVAYRHKGRSFSTVPVAISQSGKPVALATAMMDSGAEDVLRHQVPMPDVPGPEASTPLDFNISGRHIRLAGGGYPSEPDEVGPPELHAWIRFRDAPNELCLRQALVSQFIGRLTVAAAMRPQKGINEAMAHVTLSTGVLGATLTMHEEPDLSDWLLYSYHAIYAGRGLAQVEGRVFERSGRLVASSAVQVLTRKFQQDPSALGGSARAM